MGAAESVRAPGGLPSGAAGAPHAVTSKAPASAIATGGDQCVRILYSLLRVLRNPCEGIGPIPDCQAIREVKGTLLRRHTMVSRSIDRVVSASKLGL